MSDEVKKPKVKIFADGANLDEMKALAADGLVAGFTTNPSLVRKAKVSDYLAYAKSTAAALARYPLSIEVLADDFDEMLRQARIVAPLGENVYVKIPALNTKGQHTGEVIKTLTRDGIKVNITALMSTAQLLELVPYAEPGTPIVWSLFAGRLADVGRDPMPMMHACREILSARSPRWELLWASCREVWNVYQADEARCDIITAPADVIKKLKSLGRTADALARECVKIFADDAKASGFSF